MRIGQIPKDFSEEQLLAKFKEFDNFEELIFLFSGTSGLSKVFLGITKGDIFLVDQTNFLIQKSAQIDQTFSAGFSMGSWVVESNGSSLFIFGYNKLDKQLIEEAQQYLKIPLRKNAKEKLVEMKNLSLNKVPDRVLTDEFLMTYGKTIANGFLDWKVVEIFEKGFVAIANQKPERILKISSSIQVTKKSGLGHAAGNTATGILTAMVSGGLYVGGARGNRRGDVYLTIVTEVQTYILHEQLHSLSSSAKDYNSEETVLRLEAAGLVAIKNGASRDESIGKPTPVDSIASQLRELAELHSSGAITESEFIKAKKKLLSDSN